MTTRPGPLPAGLDRTGLVAAVHEGLASLPDAAPAVVALSGGADSTALAYLAAEARPDLALTLVHVRHGLRDDREDVAVVERHASFLGLPLEVRSVDVRRAGKGTEAAARDARYAAMREVASRAGAAILVGHSADDQAETVLQRAARGTGVDGIAGMAPAAHGLVRPLLRVRRADLRRFVALEGLPVAEDPTNRDPQVRRVAVRTAVLPALAEVAPDPVGALARLAALAADDVAALDELAVAALTSVAVTTGDVVCLPDAALAALPRAVARRVWRRVLVAAAGGGPPPSSATIAEVEALAPGRRLELGALEVTAGGGWRSVAPRRVPVHDPVPVEVPGTTSWPPAAVALRALTPDGVAPADDDRVAHQQIAFELADAWTPPTPDPGELAVPPGVTPPPAHPTGGRPTGGGRGAGGDPTTGGGRGTAELQRARARCHLALPSGFEDLQVRHRRPGDRCLTVVGTQRVADLLVDAKVPRPVRERWPIVVAGDRVVWIPGVAADAEAVRGGRSAPALQLVLTPGPSV